MIFLNKFKILDKNNPNDKSVKKIIEELPENKIICEEILNFLDNKTTKIILDNDIKSSYYVFLNDTIYISNKEKNRKDYHRLCLIAHECRHSVQNKLLQKLNFICANLEFILFFLSSILIIFNIYKSLFLIIYLISLIFSVTFRLMLEIDAVKASVKISGAYLKFKGNTSNNINLVENVYNSKIKSLFPMFIFQLFLDKIIRSVVILVLFRL